MIIEEDGCVVCGMPCIPNCPNRIERFLCCDSCNDYTDKLYIVENPDTGERMELCRDCAAEFLLNELETISDRG